MTSVFCVKEGVNVYFANCNGFKPVELLSLKKKREKGARTK